MRLAVIVLLIGAGVGTLSLLFGREKHPTGAVQSESAKDTADRTITANGTIEGITREIPLRFEIAGRLKTVDVEEGSEVRTGDRLARLVPDTWLHALSMSHASLELAKSERVRLMNGARAETRELAEAQVQAAKARAGQAHKRLERALKLFERSALAQQELDDLTITFEVAQSEVDAADARAREVCAPARTDELSMADARVSLEKAKFAQAEAQLAKTELVAPCDGIILRVHNQPGELVGPDSADPCLVMVEAQRKRVRAYVEEMDAPSVSAGQRAFAVADGLPKHRYWGKVISCAPSMVPKRHFNNAPSERVDVKVREVLIELEDGDELVIGLPVDVFIARNSRGESTKPSEPISAAIPKLGLPSAEPGSERPTRPR